MPNSVVWTYSRAGQAEEAQSILAGHGISSELRDENIDRTHSSSAINTSVLVPDEDVLRAEAILRKLQPEVFGSASTISRIQSDLVRSIGLYVAYVLVSGVLSFFTVARRGEFVARCEASLLIGALCGIALMMLHSKWKRRSG
ncbi:MAG: DUF2007 domain-containing protein [Verrucomicrobia bacterium]|nr:DUF2007 domain-containing protein [Verrucomicrobiota bacterium]